jgi:hypothetical protein
MAYLGNKPVNNFVSFAKQDITGNGGMSYSLDYPVTGANDIDLYINNVRQEPTEAYSCSGSTLTLTEAVSSSDDIYAIFRGRALQTAQHPSDSALEASQATISGDLTVDGNGTVLIGTDTGDSFNADSRLRIGNSGDRAFLQFKTDTSNDSGILFGTETDDVRHQILHDPTDDALIFKGNSAEAMRLDASGRVTTPNQPAWSAGLNSSQSGLLTAYTVHRNNGNHFSNGVFTCPVAGDYFISFFGMTSSAGTMDVEVRINGSTSNALVPYSSSAGFHTSIGGTTILYLNANDTIQMRNNAVQLYGQSTGRHSGFSGYLIG